jgi:Flp pilus assembly protein TadD
MSRHKPKKPGPAAAAPQKAAPGPLGKRSLRRSAILFAVLLCLAGIAVYNWTRPDAISSNEPELPPPEDPRLTIQTQFVNVKPDVRYVGTETCAGCHQSIAKRYSEHPMGRSLAPIGAATAIERYDTTARDPFEWRGFSLVALQLEGKVVHKATALVGRAEAQADIAYAIGSGRRARSYLIDQQGYLLQSPLTWYPLKGIWDYSPGYAEPEFSRAITPGCLFCHTNRVEPEPEMANRFKPPLFRGHAIGCERCHGPGEVHVQRRQARAALPEVDPTIVNPRHLEYSLREDVCRQCHVEGGARVLTRGREYFDFRPGLPLSRFVADFTLPEEQLAANQFVGSTEQMLASRCYQKSSGANKLGCISCHDPHSVPEKEKRVAFYRKRCLNCHEQHPCSMAAPARLAQSPEDSCIQCHMPNLKGSLPHTTVTYHAVPRHEVQMATPAKATEWPRPGQPALVPFPPELADLHGIDQDRNLGLGLIEIAGKYWGKPEVGKLAELALPLLQKAAAGDRHDIPAWEAKAKALGWLGRPDEALQTCTAALSVDPVRETLLYTCAALAAKQGQKADFEAYARRVVKINPWMWQYRQMLAESLVQQGQWAQAAEACLEVFKLSPSNIHCRQILIRCYLRQGNRPQARAELDNLVGIVPPNQRDEIRRWFDLESR